MHSMSLVEAPDTLEVRSPAGVQRLSGFANRARILGKGGAGTVYAHPDLGGQAVKIYTARDRASAHEAKVRAMVEAPPQGIRTRFGTVQIAWPSATVTSEGRFAGFVMPSIDFSQAWTLQQVIRPTQRSRRAIPERLELRVYAGRNLASTLNALHDMGHYVIDLKPQNVLVYRDDAGRSAAHVALVDCDGFQVRDRVTGRRFDAELATPDFLHPAVAVQTGDEASFDMRRLNDSAALQDDFALAVILFELLNDGLHPMSGREAGKGEVPGELARRLQKGGQFYPYRLGRPNQFLLPDADSLHEWFSPKLRKLFDRAFSGGQPPSAQEWVQVLGRLSAPGNACARSAEHWRLGPVCGLCARSKLASLPPNAPRPAVAGPVQVALPPRRGTAARSPKTARLRRRVALGVVLALCLLVLGSLYWREHATPSGLTAYGSGVQSTQKRAIAFVKYYYEMSSGEASSALDFDRRFYANSVEFYGRPTGISKVISAKKAFLDRWPERSYVVRQSSLATDCSASLCHISGIVDWTASSEKRRAHSNGSASFRLDVDLSDDVPKVIGEEGRVLSRRE